MLSTVRNVRNIVVVFAAATLGGCFIEGGGCSGPFCFGVSTEICDGGLFCSEEETERCPDADRIEVNSINLFNRIREQSNNCGIAPAGMPGRIAWSDELFRIADRQSLDMAGNDFVNNLGSDGLNVSDRLPEGIYSYSSQSVAGGFASVNELVSGWQSDVQECRKISSPAVADFALACRYDSDSQYGTYWTLVMAGPGSR